VPRAQSLTRRCDILRAFCQRIEKLEVHAAFECPGGPQPTPPTPEQWVLESQMDRA
jgi:hypothetical protein